MTLSLCIASTIKDRRKAPALKPYFHFTEPQTSHRDDIEPCSNMNASLFVFAFLLAEGVRGSHNIREETCDALIVDRDTCPSRNWPEEYDCIRDQNSLKDLMDCVTSRPGVEYYVCADADSDEIYDDMEPWQVDR